MVDTHTETSATWYQWPNIRDFSKCNVVSLAVVRSQWGHKPGEGGGSCCWRRRFATSHVTALELLELFSFTYKCAAGSLSCAQQSDTESRGLFGSCQLLPPMTLAMFMTPLLTPPSGMQSVYDWWIEVRGRRTFFLRAASMTAVARVFVCVTRTLRRAESSRWILKSCAPSRATGSTGVTTAMGETSKTWLSRSSRGRKVDTVCDLRAESLYRVGHHPRDNAHKTLKSFTEPHWHCQYTLALPDKVIIC